jgi:hypothetical protein
VVKPIGPSGPSAPRIPAGPRGPAGPHGTPSEGSSRALNEPRNPETGAQFEARELGADRPQRPPKSAEYFDYKGGSRGSFFQFTNQLKDHLDNLGMRDKIPINEDILKTKTEDFIMSK